MTNLEQTILKTLTEAKNFQTDPFSARPDIIAGLACEFLELRKLEGCAHWEEIRRVFVWSLGNCEGPVNTRSICKLTFSIVQQKSGSLPNIRFPPAVPEVNPGLDAAADFRRGDAFIMATDFSRQDISA